MKKYFTILFVIAAAIIFTDILSAAEPTAYDLVQSGKKLYDGVISFNLEDYSSSEKYLKESLSFYPENLESLYYYGKILSKIGHPDKAIKYWKKISDLGFEDTYPVKWKINRAKRWKEIDKIKFSRIFPKNKYVLVKEIYGTDYKTGFFSVISQIYFNLSNDLLYAASYATDEIVILNQNGEEIDTIKMDKGAKPKGINIFNDELFVTEYGTGKVSAFNKDGKTIKEFGLNNKTSDQLLGPSSITKDSYDNYYVSESGNHRISVFDNNTKKISVIGGYGSEPGLFINPGELLFDREGFLFAIDKGNRRVERFGPSGMILENINNKLITKPAGFSKLIGGDFYIINESGTVYKFIDGVFSDEKISFDNVDSDSDVIVSDIDEDYKGYIYISDLKKNRIRIYRPDGVSGDKIICDITKVDVSHYEKDHFVGIWLTVTDDRGKFYSNLNKNNFAVYENNKRMYPINVSKMRSNKDDDYYIAVYNKNDKVSYLFDDIIKKINADLKGKKYYFFEDKTKNTLNDTGNILNYSTPAEMLKKVLWKSYYDNKKRNIFFITDTVLKEEEVKDIILLSKGLHIPINTVSVGKNKYLKNMSMWTGGINISYDSPYFEDNLKDTVKYNYQEEYLIVYRTPYINVPYKTMFEVKVVLNLFKNQLDDSKVILSQDRAVYFVP